MTLTIENSDVLEFWIPDDDLFERALVRDMALAIAAGGRHNGPIDPEFVELRGPGRDGRSDAAFSTIIIEDGVFSKAILTMGAGPDDTLYHICVSADIHAHSFTISETVIVDTNDDEQRFEHLDTMSQLAFFV